MPNIKDIYLKKAEEHFNGMSDKKFKQYLIEAGFEVTEGEGKIFYKDIEMLAMAIVNFTNETNGVNVETRQKNNDKCFDYTYKKIIDFLNE